MNRFPRLLVLGAIFLSLGLSGCLLFFSDGGGQHLVLRLLLDQDVPNGAKRLLHVAVYPDGVPLKGSWVRISGLMVVDAAASPTASAALAMPGRVKASVVTESDAKGVYYRFNLNAPVRADGSFAKTKKFRKDIEAGSTQSFSLQPSGGDLVAGTVVILCVDVASRKSDLPAAGHCLAAGGPSGEAKIVEVLDNSFSPMRLMIEAGDTVRWILRGNNQSHTTTAMAGTWDSGFVFNVDGDSFERTFSAAEDGMTFEYSCVTHDAAGMRGSILVGADAEPPDDGY